MNQAYLPIQGDPVSPDELSFPKARELARFVMSEVNPFVRLLECRATSDEEVVVLEVDVELPQRPTHDIRRRERLAVTFSSGDNRQPDVSALRPDFPLVPHLNQHVKEFPRSLCLYDRPHHEIKLHWTAAAFVERIRYWLSQTGKGQLHGDDQPLEPLLFDPMQDLILPEDLLGTKRVGTPERLVVSLVSKGSNLFTAIARRVEGMNLQSGLSCVAVVVSCPPQAHGVIRHMPGTLADLDSLTVESGLDLIDTLRQTLKGWMQGGGQEFLSLLEVPMILVIQLPKTREPGGVVETIEVRAFFTSTIIKQMGVDIGVWDLNLGQPGLLLEYDDAKRGIEIVLDPLNPRRAFSRSHAAHVNGVGEPTPLKVAAIGVGALGSQVVSNLVRSGFGQWTLVDDDVLLPHNLGRHALEGFALGFPKATSLAGVLNATIDGEEVARGIVADVLNPGENIQLLDTALLEAEVILDMSAAVSVARHLCRDVKAEARRVSLFLNPSGTALTLLAEDADRLIPLDVLEMQLYRGIAANPALDGLLESHGQLRTGQSCRDVSVQIPQDLVALHAAIGSQAFRGAVGSDRARMSVWRIDKKDYTVNFVNIDPEEIQERQIGDWTLYTDSGLLSRLAELRRERLPKETGGVFLGAYDVGRKIIYVVETVPSPPDSVEWPTAYIRGSKGLQRKVQEISDATDGMLEYVGEWHSHPKGSEVTPSAADRKVLGWLGELTERDGLPKVMAIVGEEGNLNFFIDSQTEAK